MTETRHQARDPRICRGVEKRQISPVRGSLRQIELATSPTLQESSGPQDVNEIPFPLQG